jgi:phosphatidylserine decarboxylase
MTLSFVPGFATNVGQPPREERPQPRPVLGRGDELGVFHLGSTVVLLSEAPLELLPGVAVGEKVRVGQAVARQA